MTQELLASPVKSDVPALVAATAGVMMVDDVTEGVAPGNSVRLRGRLLFAPDKAYAVLAERLRPLGRTPVLRQNLDGPGEELLALPVTFRGAASRPWLALGLFVLTVVSCLFAGAQMVAGPLNTVNWRLLDGLPFAASLLAILTAHEFGHYLTARRLGSPTSLPYFIPLPVGPFGTLGAFITLGVPPRNRRHLLAIGAAGPLAGLALAIPILWLGLGLSHIEPLPAGGYTSLGSSLLMSGLTFLRFGRLLPAGGEDVFLHQVAFAGWAGLLITALNLIPAGQLDGGHIAYALLGRKGARLVTWIVIGALAALSFKWTGWLLWLALVLLFGRLQDMPLDDLTELTTAQRVLAAAMIVVFALVFVPAPIVQVP